MKYNRTFCTDSLMKNLWGCLVRDFRSVQGQDLCRRQELALRVSVKEFRATTWPARSQADPYLFKQVTQLEHLFKRYRFKDDAYTDEELEQRTFEKFSSHQCVLADTNENVSLSTYLVVQRARKIAKAILGVYDLQEHIDACRFGIKANLGVPASKAYLDVKLMTLSGSQGHGTWFEKHVVDGDPHLSRFYDSHLLLLEELWQAVPCTSLNMVNVPKSWKIKRGIIPDTVLGSFYTNGIGTVITRRLQAHGLNIRKLQQKHRRYARKFSRSRTHVTADLSNASNSFTWSLMCRLLPRKWLEVLDYGRVRRFTYAKKDYLNMSFMMMGIGYTFPVQTLLFYCLIRAVGDLLGNDRTDLVSVYGDDLIYPVAYHRYIVKVFENLGFSMNEDKTYVQDHFRESCGGDYFRGIDVRPFQLEAEHQVLHRKPYVLFLYKTLNGLLTRWNEFDIPQTVRFLLLEILRAESSIVLVPSEFPDFSGLHVGKVTLDGFWPIVRPRFNPETSLLDIYRYEIKARNRVIITHTPYYWLKLRTMSSEGQSVENALAERPISSLRWVIGKNQPRNYRSKITGQRLKLRELAEAEKMANGAIIYHNSPKGQIARV